MTPPPLKEVPSKIPISPNERQKIAVNELQKTALNVRYTILELATQGGCFIGASLSAVDLIVFLYKHFLRILSPTDEKRDLFFLSKGHDVPALYGMFVELGWIRKELLTHHLDGTENIYWHPNTKIPGIEFHSGSLGHLLSVAMGAAMDAKLSKKDTRVVVMVGDGELNEGSNWEALLVAAAYKLDNLIILVDRNAFQANVRTEDLIPLEPLPDKFRAFGAEVTTFNGHQFESIEEAFRSFPLAPGKPNVLIAETVRGKGLPSIEGRADRWFCNFSSEEIKALREELLGHSITTLTSETLMVR